MQLDAATALAADRDESGAARADAGAKRTAVVLGAGLLVAVTAIVAALVTFSDTDTPAAPRQDSSDCGRAGGPASAGSHLRGTDSPPGPVHPVYRQCPVRSRVDLGAVADRHGHRFGVGVRAGLPR